MIGKEHTGINHLANVFQKRMSQNAEGNHRYNQDFGTVQADYSLLTNTFPIPLQKNQYLICRHLMYGDLEQRLKSGDRVLVDWVGNKAVITGVIVSAAMFWEGG